MKESTDYGKWGPYLNRVGSLDPGSTDRTVVLFLPPFPDAVGAKSVSTVNAVNKTFLFKFVYPMTLYYTLSLYLLNIDPLHDIPDSLDEQLVADGALELSLCQLPIKEKTQNGFQMHTILWCMYFERYLLWNITGLTGHKNNETCQQTRRDHNSFYKELNRSSSEQSVITETLAFDGTAGQSNQDCLTIHNC